MATDPIHSTFHPDGVIDKLHTIHVFSANGKREQMLLDMVRNVGESGLTTEQRETLAKRITPEFRHYMMYYLKPKYIPSESVIEEKLVFLDSSLSSSGTDIAYLDYEVDKRKFRIAQTGEGMAGSIAICIQLKPAERAPHESVQSSKSVIKNLYGQYLVEDPRAPFAIGSLEVANTDSNWIKPENPKKNYRRNLYGAISSQGVTLVFQKKHPWYELDENHITVDPPPPAYVAPTNDWFDLYLENAPSSRESKSKVPRFGDR